MYMGFEPTLVTLMGDGTAEFYGEDVASVREYLGGVSDDALDVAERLPYMSPFARQAALRAYPELMGIWPIIAKIAQGAVAVVGRIAARVRERRAGKTGKAGQNIFQRIIGEIKYRRKLRQKKEAAPSTPPPPSIIPGNLSPDTKRLLIVAAIGIPVIGVGAYLLARRRN